MSFVLRRNPNWPESLCSPAVSGGALTLLGEDGCQVQIPAALLVAVSPLVKSMMAGLLPPAYSPHVISIPAVTGDVLLMVAELLSKGAAVVHAASNDEVQEVFKMLVIEIFLSYCLADGEVKDEDLTEDCSQSEIHVKMENFDESEISEYYDDFDILKANKIEDKNIVRNLLEERNYSSSDILLPFKDNKPDEKKHKLVHSREKPFACEKCAHRAVSRKKLKEHMLVHSIEKPFSCDHCSYRSVRRGDLNKHMVIHSSEKPYPCEQCTYKAAGRKLLNKHMQSHKEEKLFGCDQCAYRAVSTARLKQHMPIHSKEKLFACDQCDYKGNSLRYLSRHKGNCHSTHKLRPTPREIDPVHCIHCGKLCKNKIQLQKHMERRHIGLATPRKDEPIH